MAVRKVYGTQNVLDAAMQRIKNIFSNGVPVYMSFSCGKDSLCMAHITYDLILRGEISAKQLIVIFIDEEGLYKSMLDAAYRWREKFLRVGAKFNWYCLQVKQVCVIDNLSKTENWITWDKTKREVWMREPPPFAITESPLLPYPGFSNYQDFCDRLTKDGIQMIGVRTSESLQRLKMIAHNKGSKHSRIYPIYDWKDTDIWLYIKENNLEFPDIYIRLYEAGCPKKNLRLCCFFGDSSIVGLKWVAETEPELWQKIECRYPNAYLVLLYWDSEMFKRHSRKRTELEKDIEEQDYKAKLYDLLFLNTEKYNIPPDTKKWLRYWRNLLINKGHHFTQKEYRTAYEAILSGDPKRRTARALFTAAGVNRVKDNRKEKL